MSAMVIIGAGECGGRAACALREQGWDGDIQLLGAETWGPYERPPLSKAALIDDEPPASPVVVLTPDTLDRLGIMHGAGVRADLIDRDSRHVVLSDGERLGYHKVLLATGATPRQLSVAAGCSRAHMLRTHEDALRLRAALRPGHRVTIIGAGFIGLELAAAATTRGCRVTVLETADRVMGRAVPADIAEVVRRRHQDAGVDIRCGVQIVAITEGPTETVVELSDGTNIPGDVLVVGIGAVPETSVAEKSGLEVGNGILVDEYLATTDPDIFAAGDCASFPHPLYDGARIRLEAWRNAQDQALVAAINMCGGRQEYIGVPWFWSDQFDLGLQVAGLPAQAAFCVTRHRADGVDVEFGIGADGRVLSAAAVGPRNSVAKDIRLAEMIIARQISPDPQVLADPDVNLKLLLR